MGMDKHPGSESISSKFEQIKTTDENVWTSAHPGLGSELLSSVCLSRSESPMRMCGHPSIQDQEVSCSLVFEQIRTTDKNWSKPIQAVSPSPLFKQIRTTDKNG